MSRRLTHRNNLHDAVGPLASELTVSPDGAAGADFRALHAELLGFAGYARKPVCALAAAQLTEEAVQRSALGEPLLVPAAPGAAAELGLGLPAEPLTPDRVATHLGPNYEVRTFDAASQVEGPHWTLHQWNLYWEARRPLSKDIFTAPAPRPSHFVEDEADSAAVTRKRTADSDITGQQLKGITPDCKRRLLQVLHLAVAGTPLEAQIHAPAAVRAADLLQQVWPADAPYRPHTSAYLVMSPAGAYTDFRMAGGGAGFWCHLVSGAKTFALCPPTPRNLATYTAWASGARHSAVFLPQHCEGTVRVDLRAGDTLVVPPGWVAAAATTAPAISVAGNFLLRDSLAVHLEAWRIEEHLGVHPRARFPLFKQLMWYTAAHYARALQQLAGLSDPVLQERAAAKQGEWVEAEAAAAEAAAAAAELGSGRADSDSVMGTSKAGTTTQRRAGQPTSTRDDACNQAPAQPGVSAGNRSIILQHRAPARVAPAVNSRPAGGADKGRAGAAAAAGGAGPSAAALAIARGEQKLAGSKRRRPQRSDSFIASDDEQAGRRRAGSEEEQDWAPEGSSGEEAASDEEEPEEEWEHNGQAEMVIDEELEGRGAHPSPRWGAAGAEGSPGGRAARRQRLAGVPAVGGGGGARPSPLGGPSATAEGSARGARKTTTRFRGSLPPKLAAMLQTLSGEDSPPHGSAAGSAGNHHQPGNHHAAHADTAATSGHGSKPIRLKVKLRPLESQPATSGGPASAPGGGRSTPSGTPFGRASPRKLIVKISKAATTPKSHPIVGAAPVPTGRSTPGHPAATPTAAVAPNPAAAPPAAALQSALSARAPAALPAATPVAATPASATPALPQQQQQPHEPEPQQQALQPTPPALTIPQVDGAWDGGGGDNDSTVAVGAPPQPPGEGSASEDEVAQGAGEAAGPAAGTAPEGQAALGEQEQQQQEQGGAAAPAASQEGSGAAAVPRQRGQAEEQQQQQQQQAQPSRGAAAAADSMHAEYARMYAELEANHLGSQPPAPAGAPGPAESGGSVGAMASGSAPPQRQLQQEQQAAAAPTVSTGAAGLSQQQPPPPPPPPQQCEEGPGAVGQPAAASPAQPSPEQAQQAGVSAVEAEGLAALLAVLRKWVVAHNALNDVPLSITSPREVLARLEVCMQALGLPLIPPPPVDLEAVPLDRLRPRRPPGPAGTAATAGGSRRQRSLLAGGRQGSGLVEAEVQGLEECGGDSMEADLNVVVEESCGPPVRPDAAGGKGQAGRGQALAARGKKLSVKQKLMKKLHFK